MELAIAGTGGIVKTCLDALKTLSAVHVAAICGRPASEAKARKLADAYGIPQVYTDYDAMLKNDHIDFIYVGIINSMHFNYAKRALLAGKNVICEKPITSHIKELDELTSIATEKQLFLFEAITLLHSPNYAFIQRHLPAIGRLRIVQANYFQYSSRYDKFLQGIVLPAFDPSLSGGCLYDLNVYNLHFVMGLLGTPNDARYYANIAANGIDTSGAAILTYDGTVAVCSAAKDSESISGVILEGEKGYIHLNSTPNVCRNVILKTADNIENFDGEKYDNRMVNEFAAFAAIYKKNDLAACRKLLKHSHVVMQVMTKLRIGAGIKFSADAQ
ncbi:Gfo/Idh/MocA family protein [Pectinatus cerevisiiphilus]|uniref:Putative dehydrogenase n=1 Tax=Pectinatus cerevisiiphilus TaxID=86956 RepID=A0A4R3KFG3_9FIRM|nr:Gfo/Idh/MocA family oxidoreductase [Pectinatus cerevisiiphilus]TCS82018.1 putative dehydrogenase [Pectinatus cerevisiiphilus]